MASVEYIVVKAMHLQEVLCLQSLGIQALLSDQASLAKPPGCRFLQLTLDTLHMGRPEDLTENACDERAHGHTDQNISMRSLWYYTFSPLGPPGPLGP